MATKTAKKPKCKLVGENGNIFNLLGLASNALKRQDRNNPDAKTMRERVFKAKSYDEALAIITEYVDAY